MSIHETQIILDQREEITELERLLFEWHRIYTGADLCAGCVAEWNVSLRRVEEARAANG